MILSNLPKTSIIYAYNFITELDYNSISADLTAISTFENMG
jgi:hypothetical protein